MMAAMKISDDPDEECEVDVVHKLRPAYRLVGVP